MGACSSTVQATAVTPITAKVVDGDGRLREFALPARASHVLGGKGSSSACFVCDSDDMEFGLPARAMGDDDELFPGQLYFLLPNSMLRQPLQAEDMAALAVRANAALSPAGCRRWSVAPLRSLPLAAVAHAELEIDMERKTAQPSRRQRNSSRGKGREFSSDLGSIPE